MIKWLSVVGSFLVAVSTLVTNGFGIFDRLHVGQDKPAAVEDAPRNDIGKKSVLPSEGGGKKYYALQETDLRKSNAKASALLQKIPAGTRLIANADCVPGGWCAVKIAITGESGFVYTKDVAHLDY